MVVKPQVVVLKEYPSAMGQAEVAEANERPSA